MIYRLRERVGRGWGEGGERVGRGWGEGEGGFGGLIVFFSSTLNKR